MNYKLRTINHYCPVKVGLFKKLGGLLSLLFGIFKLPH